jgi:hypothetical protein
MSVVINFTNGGFSNVRYSSSVHIGSDYRKRSNPTDLDVILLLDSYIILSASDRMPIGSSYWIDQPG